MFPRSTVFVVGAGASHDLELPTGDGLRTKLIELLDRTPGDDWFNDDHFNRAIHILAEDGENSAFNLNTYRNAALQILSGLPLAISIDNYLHAHRDNDAVRTLGKIAIATVILDAERNSLLNMGSLATVEGIDRYAQHPRLAESWYLPLMRLLTAERSVNELASLFENVAFIVFNYDRCLEHFLVNAIMAYFHVPPREAIDCVNQLAIIHPYGQVGHLPWREQALTARFGNPGADLVKIAKGIQTFTESADKGTITEVRDMVRGAETLIFMGYGFLAQNNDLLRSQNTQVRRVFATTHGISDSDIPIVKEEISRIIGKQETETRLERKDRRFAEIFIERGTCRHLMDNHRFRLAREPESLL